MLVKIITWFKSLSLTSKIKLIFFGIVILFIMIGVIAFVVLNNQLSKAKLQVIQVSKDWFFKLINFFGLQRKQSEMIIDVDTKKSEVLEGKIKSEQPITIPTVDKNQLTNDEIENKLKNLDKKL